MRGNIYTFLWFLEIILQTKATLFNTLSFSLSLSLSPSLALPFPPWVSTSSNPGFQDCANNGTLLNRWLSLKVHHNSNNPKILNNYLTFTVTTETVQ